MNYYQMTQQPKAPPPAPKPVPAEERAAHAVRRLRDIRNELHSATYATIVRDRVRELMDVVEFLLTGLVSEAVPNQTPGSPPAEDYTKTRVEFVRQSGAPVNSADVIFTPSAPSSQRVEFVSNQPAGQIDHHPPATNTVEAGDVPATMPAFPIATL
jgi:hypothetical protein